MDLSRRNIGRRGADAQLLHILLRVQEEQVGRRGGMVDDLHAFAERLQDTSQPDLRTDRIGVGTNMAGNYKSLIGSDDRTQGFPVNCHFRIVD